MPVGKIVTPEVLKERMRQHIMTVVGRYKGRVKGWDVVNEAFEDNAHTVIASFIPNTGQGFHQICFFSLLMKPTPKAEFVLTTIIM